MAPGVSPSFDSEQSVHGSTVVIQATVEGELGELAIICHRCFREAQKAFVDFSAAPEADHVAQRVRLLRRYIVEREMEMELGLPRSTHFFTARHAETNEAIGFTVFHAKNVFPVPEGVRERIEAGLPSAEPHPAGVDRERRNAFFDLMRVSSERHMGERAHVHIDLVCVAESARRLRAGAALFSQALEVARRGGSSNGAGTEAESPKDEEQIGATRSNGPVAAPPRLAALPLHLDAIPTAVSYWKRQGFMEKELLQVEPGCSLHAMVREAETLSS